MSEGQSGLAGSKLNSSASRPATSFKPGGARSARGREGEVPFQILAPLVGPRDGAKESMRCSAPLAAAIRWASTGRASWGSRRRAYVLNVSTSWRCASVQIVSNTSDKLPLPLTPREGDQPVLRHVDVDALEVVRAGASDLDGGHLRPS